MVKRLATLIVQVLGCAFAVWLAAFFGHGVPATVLLAIMGLYVPTYVDGSERWDFDL